MHPGPVDHPPIGFGYGAFPFGGVDVESPDVDLEQLFDAVVAEEIGQGGVGEFESPVPGGAVHAHG
ncbi:MAG: hypothetical protein KatS3mg011_1222 [Acidimicrobiia bacterium]|nr:MAG: hypothetical protein KatS3mg011_1222 [Acidimicrobiia bacterium]